MNKAINLVFIRKKGIGMKIVEALEHNGELYRVGDFVKVTYNNGCSNKGIIRYFGEATDTGTSQTDDYLEFGKYMERLSEIVSIERVS